MDKLEVVRVGQNEAKKWNHFVEGTTAPSLMQSWEWGEFKAQFGWKVVTLAVVQKFANEEGIGQGRVLAGAQVLIHGLPFGRSFFYTPQAPLFAATTKPHHIKPLLKLLLAEIEKYAIAENCAFLRVDPGLSEQEFDVQELVSLGFTKSFEELQPRHSQWIDLDQTPEKMLAQMEEKGRYNIRLATKKGVKVRFSTAAADVEAFINMQKETATRDGFRIHTDGYFKAIIETLAKKDMGSLVIAEYEGEPLAMILVSYFGKRAVYLYGASSNKHREFMATYLVQWEAMLEAKKRGSLTYDLWGIAKNDDPKNHWIGLRRFKKKFGGQQVDLIGSYDLAYQKVYYKLFCLAQKLRKKIFKLGN